MQERRKSLRLHTEISTLVTTERKTPEVSNCSSDNKSPSKASKIKAQSPSDNSIGDLEIVSKSLPNRKRKKHHSSSHQKRLKRSSVESHTVSVTRIDTPIYEDSLANFFSPLSSGDDATFMSPSKDLSPVLSPTVVEPSATEKDEKPQNFSDSKTPTKVKQRSFRVSLSLPDNVEKKPPNETDSSCMKTPTLSVQSWGEIVSSVSPKSISPSTEGKDLSLASAPQSRVKEEQKHVPFLASPLPIISSKKQLEKDPAAELTVSTENLMEKQLGWVVTETIVTTSNVEDPSVTKEQLHGMQKDESITKELEKQLQDESKPQKQLQSEPVERTVAFYSSGMQDESIIKDPVTKKQLQLEPVEKPCNENITKDEKQLQSAAEPGPVERTVKSCSSGENITNELTKKQLLVDKPFSESNIERPAKLLTSISGSTGSKTEHLLGAETDAVKPSQSAAGGITTVSVGYSAVSKKSATGKTFRSSTNPVVIKSIKTLDSSKSLSNSPSGQVIADSLSDSCKSHQRPEKIQTASPSCTNPKAVKSLAEHTPTHIHRQAGSEAKRPAVIQSLTKTIKQGVPQEQTDALVVNAAVTSAKASGTKAIKDAGTKPLQSPNKTKHEPSLPIPAKNSEEGTETLTTEHFSSAESELHPALSSPKHRPSVLGVEKHSTPVKSSPSHEGTDSVVEGSTPAVSVHTPVITTTKPQVRPQHRPGASVDVVLHHKQMGKSDKGLITSPNRAKQLSSPAAAAAAAAAVVAAAASASTSNSPQPKSLKAAGSRPLKEFSLGTAGNNEFLPDRAKNMQ